MLIKDYKCFTVNAGWRNLTYLMIIAENGTIGFGEAHIVGKTHTVREYLKDIRRHIIGQDIYNIEDLYRKITLLDFGIPGQVAMTGLSLIEMACWDCIGKIADLPVYKLLGGAVREKIPAYANGWYRVQRKPEEFIKAAEKVITKGYKALKFDPFGNGDLEIDKKELCKAIELVDSVYSVTQNKAELFIEMHGRFAPYQAVEICRLLEKYNPGFIEEPCRPQDVQAIKYVMDHTCIPIASGERLYNSYAYREVFHDRLAHIIQPDISQCGGILEVKKIASTAETYSMMVAPHNVGGIIATAANLHLLATLRNGKILEHFNDFSDEFIKEVGFPYPEVVDGNFNLPHGPGWGIEIDLKFLEDHCVKNDVIQDPGLNMFKNADWNLRKSDL